jgi:hypothetical protein
LDNERREAVHNLAGLIAVVAVVVATRPCAAAQHPDEVPLGDVIQVITLDNKVIAVDARGGGQKTIRLKAKEKVLWTGARGEIGVAITSYRMLAISAGSSAWQELSYAAGEALPESALLGDRLALLVTGQRVVGFNGQFVETTLAATEDVLASRVGQNVGVVVTTHRALGLSPGAGFVEVPMEAREQVAAVTVGANLATVTTEHRIRVFRAPSASWEVRRVQD